MIKSEQYPILVLISNMRFQPYLHQIRKSKITFHCAFKQRHTQRHIMVYTSCDTLQPGSCTASGLFIHVMFKKQFQAFFFLETKKKSSCKKSAVLAELSVFCCYAAPFQSTRYLSDDVCSFKS